MGIRSPLGTWTLDLTDQSMTCSAACKANYGRTADQPFSYHDLAASILDEDRPRWAATVAAGLASGTSFESDYRVRWPDGAIHTVIVRGTLVTPTVLMGTSFDATEQRSNEAKLEAASRAKDEFIAMLGHELRNPLAPIATALELMEAREPERFVKERRIISRQVNHLTRLVDDLLDVARITAGNVPLEPRRVSLSQVVADAVETSAQLLEDRRHRVTLTLADDLDVTGDQFRLTQVVANLLTNAAKYTDPGGAISVSTSADGDHAVVRVRDNGVGIGPEILPQIFDSFVQEQQPIDRRRGGLGLGLAIVRALVEMHGGSASVASDGLGRGSEFTVRLPRATGARAATPASEQATSAVSSSCRFLLVDDNVDASELLSAVLEARGHVTRVAHDGPAALSALDSFVPDIAILDIGLPGMNGYELGRRIREDRRFAKVQLIALTGYAQPADRERSRLAGFDAHLAKPIDLASLDALLERSRATDS